jgi:low temperature requirement protein LtrA
VSGDDELRVSTLELFFDLVFVFTITQLTGLLGSSPTPESAVQVGLVFVVLFWMYGGYAWLTNAVPPDRPARRLLLILGMGAFFVCALAIPRVFDGDGVIFGLGYLFVVAVHAGLYAKTYGNAVFVRLAPLNGLAAGLVIAAGALDRPAVYLLWIAAIGIQFVAPRIAGSGGAFELRAGHFVERHGLLLIVALGESVIAVGFATGGAALHSGTIAAALLGLAVAAGLWWTYFGEDEAAAGRAMSRAAVGPRFGLAINGFFFAFIPMLLGIVATAAGIRGSIGQLALRLEPAHALTLSAGVALYLGGEVLFRRVMGIAPTTVRAASAVAALATAALGVTVGGGAQLVALAAIPVVVIALERRTRSAPAH